MSIEHAKPVDLEKAREMLDAEIAETLATGKDFDPADVARRISEKRAMRSILPRMVKYWNQAIYDLKEIHQQAAGSSVQSELFDVKNRW